MWLGTHKDDWKSCANKRGTAREPGVESTIEMNLNAPISITSKSVEY
jgi:hypothetical protein